MKKQFTGSKTAQLSVYVGQKKSEGERAVTKIVCTKSKRIDFIIKRILLHKVIGQITTRIRYAPQIWVIKDGQGNLLTKPG